MNKRTPTLSKAQHLGEEAQSPSNFDSMVETEQNQIIEQSLAAIDKKKFLLNLLE